MKKLISNRAMRIFYHILILLAVFCSTLGLPGAAQAAATLSVVPLTWNIIGLDSNNVLVGPNHFPVGARVCNTNSSAKTVDVQFHWDDSQGVFSDSAAPDPYINLRPGTLDGSGLKSDGVTPAQKVSLSFAAGAPGACQDAYFEVEVRRNSTAYNNSRPYFITATDQADGTNNISTPRKRYLFVEHLISQNRNTVSDLQLSTSGLAGSFTSIAPGGAMSLAVGNTYWIKLVGATATQGYDQIESFINLPNTIFQVQQVNTTYSAETSPNMTPYSGALYNQLYGDACLWENDPNSPNYKACLSTGKAGGNVTVTYKITVLSSPSAPLTNPEPINTLIYDFSGSSFHYNSDYSANARYTTVIDTTQIKIAKNFSPDPIQAGGVSALTFTITNPFSSAISDINFIDTFPTTPGAMTLTTPLPGSASNTCGGKLTDKFGGTLSADSASLKLAGGVLSPNSTCTITVNVTAPVTGTYTNNPGGSEHLFVGTKDSGSYATDTLTVTAAATLPAAPASCATPVELARWEMDSGVGANGSPLVTSRASDVDGATTVASYTSVSGAQNIDAAAGGTLNSWGGTAPTAGNGWAETPTSMANYFQFVVDTHNYNGVYVTFNANPYGGGDWANPNSDVFVNIQANNLPFEVYQKSPTPTYLAAAKNAWTNGLIARAITTGTSTTTFRFGTNGANKSTARFYLDSVIFMGCRRPNPPQIIKTFSPASVAVGTTSTLTFTVTNPNTPAGQTLSGFNLSDYLPQEALQGTAAVSGTAVTGTGSAFKTQLVSGSLVSLPSAISGTVSVAQGSSAVTGSSSAFTSDVVVGSILSLNSVGYSVASITDSTHLTLSTAYAGANQSGLTAAVYKTYSVSAIADDTHLTLGSSYSGGLASGLTMLSGLTFDTAITPITTCGTPITNLVSAGRAITLSGGGLTGTLTFTNASTSVTGSGTKFLTELGTGTAGAGRIFSLPYQLTGTMAVTNGSAAIVGTSTTFSTQLAIGSTITINSVDYIVQGITDATHLAIATPYSGSTASGLSARGYRDYSLASVTNDTTLVLGSAYSSAATLSGLTVTPKLNSVSSNTCTVTATVKANAAGVRTNVSELISSNEGGQNKTSDGYATANLNSLLPPVISKQFSPNPIQTNGKSSLVFTLTNPNQNDDLSGVAFSDSLPATPGQMTVANPLTTGALQLSYAAATSTITRATGSFLTDGFVVGNFLKTDSASNPGPFTILQVLGNQIVVKQSLVNEGPVSNTIYRYSTSGCGSPTFAPAAGALSISFTNGTVTKGGTCIVSVDVTAPVAAIQATVQSVTDDTHLTLSAIAGSTASGLSVSKGPSALSGTVSISASSASITGVGTHFNSAVSAGDLLYIGTYPNTSGAVSASINSSTVNGNTASSSLTVKTPVPALTFKKFVASGTNLAPSGQWLDKTLALPVNGYVWYQFVAENTGDLPFTLITGSDPNVNIAGCAWANGLGTISAGNPLPVVVAGNDNHIATCQVGPIHATAAGSFLNTASVTGTYASGTSVSNTDDATYDTASLSILKSATETYYLASGDVLHYQFLVTNTGSASLKGPLTVLDDKSGNESCPAVNSVGDLNDWLDPGENLTCTATYSVSAAAGDISLGHVTNTADATAFLDSLATLPISSLTSSKTIPYATVDLTLNNNASASMVRLGNSFNWTLTLRSAANPVDITFADGQTIASEPLPAGPTYGSVTPANFTLMTGSGNISCAISSNILTCKALGGMVTFNAGSSSFTATFNVTPSELGDLSATATIDPSGLIYENNEGNNSASNTVTVVAIDAVDDTGVVVVDAVGGTPVADVLVNDTLGGSPATKDNVTLTPIGSWPTGISLNTDTLDTNFGAVTVGAGTTAAGIYTPQYQICRIDYPAICDTATVKVQVIYPTAVNVNSFRAVRTGPNRAALSWEMANGMKAVGFNLYRRVGQEGAEVKLNSGLILAQHSGQMVGGSYTFEDDGALAGAAYFYRLECIDIGLQAYDDRLAALKDFSIFLPLLHH